MAKQVKSFVLPNDVNQEIEMPVGANVVGVKADGSVIRLFAEVETTETETEDKVFSVYESEESIGDFENKSYMSTVDIGELTPEYLHIYAHV